MTSIKISIPITDLEVNYHFRNKVEEDYVLQLALIYEEEAEKIARVKVRSVGPKKGHKFEIIDGRERVLAADMVGIEKIPCEVIKCNEHEARILGFTANINPKASMPYMVKDIVKFVADSLDAGIPVAKLTKILREHYPDKAVDSYIKRGGTQWRDKRAARAISEFRENGASLESVSKKHRIKLQRLLRYVDQDINPETGMAAKKAGITKRYDTLKRAISGNVECAVARFLEGQETHDQCIDFVNHVIRQNTGLEKFCLDKIARMKGAIE